MSLLSIASSHLVGNTYVGHEPGSLIVAPSETSAHAGPFWGLRFDGKDDAGAAAQNIMWLNGMPWHGPQPAFVVMNLAAHRMGEDVAVGCGVARIEVDLESGVGGRRADTSWSRAAGCVAVSKRGTFLIGAKGERSMYGGYFAIDLATWTDVSDAHSDDPAEWFSRWRLMIGDAKRDGFEMSFDARAKPVANAA